MEAVDLNRPVEGKDVGVITPEVRFGRMHDSMNNRYITYGRTRRRAFDDPLHSAVSPSFDPLHPRPSMDPHPTTSSHGFVHRSRYPHWSITHSRDAATAVGISYTPQRSAFPPRANARSFFTHPLACPPEYFEVNPQRVGSATAFAPPVSMAMPPPSPLTETASPNRQGGTRMNQIAATPAPPPAGVAGYPAGYCFGGDD